MCASHGDVGFVACVRAPAADRQLRSMAEVLAAFYRNRTILHTSAHARTRTRAHNRFRGWWLVVCSLRGVFFMCVAYLHAPFTLILVAAHLQRMGGAKSMGMQEPPERKGKQKTSEQLARKELEAEVMAAV